MKRLFIILFLVLGCDQSPDLEGDTDMVLRPDTFFSPTRIDTTDTDFAYGKAKDESAEGADDGTPYTKEVTSTLFGIIEALSDATGIIPNNQIDGKDGQIRDMLDQYPQSLDYLTDGTATITDGTFTLTIANNEVSVSIASAGEAGIINNYVYQSEEPGTSYHMRTRLDEGAVYFDTNASSPAPGRFAQPVKLRRAMFDIDATSWTETSSIFTVTPALTLTGIPTGSEIQGVFLTFRDAGVTPARQKVYACSAEIDRSGATPIVITLKGINAGPLWVPSAGLTSAYLTVDYDPSNVD